MCPSRVCVIHVFAYQHSRGVNGQESPVALGPTLNEMPARRSAPVESRPGPISGHICDSRARRCISRGSREAAPIASPHTSYITHAGGQLRLRVRGWWYRRQSAERRSRILRDTVFRERHSGRRHYPGPDRCYDQLGRAKCMIAPSIHKAPLAWRSYGYGCYVRFNLRNMFLFLHHNLGRQLDPTYFRLRYTMG